MRFSTLDLAVCFWKSFPRVLLSKIVRLSRCLVTFEQRSLFLGNTCSPHFQKEYFENFPNFLRSRLRRSPRRTVHFSECEAVINKQWGAFLIDKMAFFSDFNGIDLFEMGQPTLCLHCSFYIELLHCKTLLTCTRVKVRKSPIRC